MNEYIVLLHGSEQRHVKASSPDAAVASLPEDDQPWVIDVIDA
jgi:hypothetical protein